MTIANEPAKIYQTPNGYYTKTGIKLDKDSMVKMAQGFIFSIGEEVESSSTDEYDVLEVKENLLSGKITRSNDLKQVIEHCNKYKETALQLSIAFEHKVKPLQDADNFKRAYLNYLEHHDLWQALPEYTKKVHLKYVNSMAAGFSTGLEKNKDTNISLLLIDAVKDFAALLLKEEGRYKSSPYYDRWVFDRKEGQEQYEKIKNVIAECDKHIRPYFKYQQENNEFMAQ